jgi:tryptophan halogenase
VLHYHATAPERTGELWAHCRHMSLPDELVYKEEHFRRTGRIVLWTDELFKEASWFAVMMGQGIQPTGYNPLTDVYAAEANLAHLAGLKAAIQGACERLPAHETFLPDAPPAAMTAAQ